MAIHIPYSPAEQRKAFDEVEHFRFTRRYRTGKIRRGLDDEMPLPQISQCKFADNERVSQHCTGLKQFDQ